MNRTGATDLGRRYSIAILDIDHFKKVNDTHGHAAGDAVLIELARRTTEVIGSDGIVFRYGGEEFAIILPETSTKAAEA